MIIMRTAPRMMILRGVLSPWVFLNEDHENCPEDDDHENCPEDDDHEKRLEAQGLAE